MGLEKGKGALKLKGDDGTVKKKKKKKNDKSLALVETDEAEAKPKVTMEDHSAWNVHASTPFQVQNDPQLLKACKQILGKKTSLYFHELLYIWNQSCNLPPN